MVTSIKISKKSQKEGKGDRNLPKNWSCSTDSSWKNAWLSHGTEAAAGTPGG
jgi:hypothetical protein